MTTDDTEATETFSPAAIKKQAVVVVGALEARNALKATFEKEDGELTEAYSDECEKFADMRGTGAFSCKGFKGSISNKGGKYFLKKLPNSEIEKY